MNIKSIIEFVRDVYKTDEFIPLHAPVFNGNEKKYVLDTLDSTFVSSVGKYVDDFERKMESYTGTARAVATVNGTAALSAALYLAGVKRGDLVITQALTFIATCNALYHLGAEPVFTDVSPVSMGLCPVALDNWLSENTELTEKGCVHRKTRQVVRAVVPMHTFGHPVELDELITVCQKWHIVLVEDAAESLGSFYKGKHTGTLGDYGALSFNGNKIITTGGGGMVLCRSSEAGVRAKHVTTTAKVPHPYEFYHDEPGFNYRMPNLNAALGCGQMERLDSFLKQKRELAQRYEAFFAGSEFRFVKEPEYAQSNFWLNAIICENMDARDAMLVQMNEAKVMVRPIWKLMHRLPMFEHAMRDDLKNSEQIEARLINIPSSSME
ncbi:LegC family aminotransferase [Escherichia coli]|uniref:LegC family aminotransferase n=1 Tax=Escherichia coli TaxID=562 RepID=UPI000BE139B6|nr:LegC family aminotransferase [Escherichia coli]EFI4460027.1 LegC family aminotransferase [Escherichia coli]EIV6970800.1 LegC family aminotransferase [Escherichia coli]EIV6980681.1 LegC family aminotransferase [Escherichia coli]EJA9188311.1 LegC family aminotransferase [Escherichia coli]EJF1582803.1 LegC family aminotransferase [Escherichia coli]